MYDLCVKFINANYGYLSLILIGEICRDCTKYSKMKKAILQSKYLNKFKKLVKDFKL